MSSRAGHWKTVDGRPVWVPPRVQQANDKFQALRDKISPPVYEARLTVEGPKRAGVASELRAIAHEFPQLTVDIQEYDLPKRFLQFQQTQLLITVSGPKDLVQALVEALEDGIEDYNARR